MMSQSGAFTVLLAVFCFTSVVFTAPLASLTGNTAGESKDVMSVLFNRTLPPTWKWPSSLMPAGNFGPCFQSCMLLGKTVSEVHVCSRQCLANAGVGAFTNHV